MKSKSLNPLIAYAGDLSSMNRSHHTIYLLPVKQTREQSFFLFLGESQ